MNTMPSSEDHIPVVRGRLKLKGSGPIGIQKKKKKKKKKSNEISNDTDQVKNSSSASIQSNNAHIISTDNDIEGNNNIDDTNALINGKGNGEGEGDELIDLDKMAGKTASERAFEETRKKRLMDRLAKEGLKTHKQCVEELNKYLSNLSEHHDMPRIGPG